MEHRTGNAVVVENRNRNRNNNANRQQRKNKPVANKGQSKAVNFTLTMKDVLELIPSYSGDDMCEFVRFKHGCKEALSLIGPENEKTLLLFLKLKLKGLIYSELSLHMSKYKSIEMFLKHLKKEYLYIDRVSTWRDEFHRLYQKEYETIDLYARRFQYVLQCVRIHFDSNYVMNMDESCNRSMVKLDDWERVAKYYFIQNLISVKLQQYLVQEYDLTWNLDGLMRTAYTQHMTFKKISTCKLCLENNHVDEDCTAMNRDYYASFKESMCKMKYNIINHEDDEYPYPGTEEIDSDAINFNIF